MSTVKRFYLNLILLLSLIANLLLGLAVGSNLVNSAEKFPYLSKRIFTEEQNDILINFIPLRTAMRRYISEQPDPIGLYFEYLPSGTSIGVNDQMEVRVASLVKVPAVMAIMSEVENGHLSLDKVLTIREEDLDEHFGDLWKKGAGATLTVQEAVDLALKESDNTAVNLLFSQLPKGSISVVYNALDIPIGEGASFPSTITPKSYTSILRSLYLSSLLTKEDSNSILSMLTQSKFRDKLPAGVPADTPVAHKIGVFQKQGEPTVYSDCGIVYIPNRPYTLCIMVQGNEPAAREYMRLLSEMTYVYITDVAK